MDLPITLKFFKKLELYQEIKRGNKLTTEKTLWSMEKVLLRWTVREHQHLNSSISRQDIKDILKKEGFTEENLIETDHVMGNLLVRRLAEPDKVINEKAESIKFTLEGLIMGEVIWDMEKGSLCDRLKYQVFYRFIWAMVVITFIVLMTTAANQLISLINTL